MRPVLLEAALNEDTSRAANRSVPLSSDEVAADARAALDAGASLIHFHARTADGVQAPDDTAHYRGGVASLAEGELWYPPQGDGPDPAVRWSHVGPLVEDPGLELITIDPGSFDLMMRDPDTGEIRVPPMQHDFSVIEGGGRTVVGPVEQWVWFCREATRVGTRPIFGVMEPGWLRRILAFHDAGLVAEPIVVHVFLTERLGFGLPAEPASLDVYRRMVPDGISWEWICCPIGVSRSTEQALLQHALDNGGHVRAGIGCSPTDGFDPPAATNRQLVARAVEMIEASGNRVATRSEARALLGIDREVRS